MKIELSSNKVFFENNGSKKEIHPFWLRERVNGENFVDKGTQQRLFDPTELKKNIQINKINLSEKFLEISFNDGVQTKLEVQNILREFSNINEIKFIKKIKWDSSLDNFNNFDFDENIFEDKKMYEALIDFYNFGFVIFKNVPTKNNFIVNFANSIGSIRRTNFGEFFNVKSKPNPNDLAYTSLSLAPHTDNPYRNPVPCIQLLHCIENKVSGGLSTLVDGYTVTEKLKDDFPDYYKILTETKIRYQFIDQNVFLEDWAEMIQLDENGIFKQILDHYCNNNNNVIAVIGDGAMSAGMAYEAMNNAGALKSKLIVIFDDFAVILSNPIKTACGELIELFFFLLALSF